MVNVKLLGWRDFGDVRVRDVMEVRKDGFGLRKVRPRSPAARGRNMVVNWYHNGRKEWSGWVELGNRPRDYRASSLPSFLLSHDLGQPLTSNQGSSRVGKVSIDCGMTI